MAFFLTFFSGGGRVRHVSLPLLTQLRLSIQSFYRTKQKTARRKKQEEAEDEAEEARRGAGKESTVKSSE